jgi:hypothetical protein
MEQECSIRHGPVQIFYLRQATRLTTCYFGWCSRCLPKKQTCIHTKHIAQTANKPENFSPFLSSSGVFCEQLKQYTRNGSAIWRAMCFGCESVSLAGKRKVSARHVASTAETNVFARRSCSEEATEN